MSTITIHQLEPDIAQQLEQRATQHGRTIELEIKAILKSVLAPKKPSNMGASHVGMSINTYKALWTEKGKDRWER